MDYAKLAYLKADDLAKRIANIEQAKVNAFSSTSVSKNLNKQFENTVQTGSVRVFASPGKGITFIVRLRLTLAAGGETALKIHINDILCHSATVAFIEGRQDYFSLLTVTATDSVSAVSLSLEGENIGGTLDSMEVAAWGDRVSRATDEYSLTALDGGDGLPSLIAAYVGGELIYYAAPAGALPDPSGCAAVFGRVKSFGVCRSLSDGSRFKAAYVSEDGGLLLSFLDTPQNYVKIDENVSAVSISSGDGEYAVAYIKGGKGYYRAVSVSGAVSLRRPFALPAAEFEGVINVPGSGVPAFILRAYNDRLYYKCAGTRVDISLEKELTVRVEKEFL